MKREILRKTTLTESEAAEVDRAAESQGLKPAAFVRVEILKAARAINSRAAPARPSES